MCQLWSEENLSTLKLKNLKSRLLSGLEHWPLAPVGNVQLSHQTSGPCV